VSYEVYYSTENTSPTETSPVSTTNVVITDTSATITGLADETTYYVWLRAVNSSGKSPWSTGKTAATIEVTGTLTLKISFDKNIPLSSPGTIYKNGSPASLILEVEEEYDSYEWIVDGDSKGTGQSIILNAGDYTLGTHYVTIKVAEGARFYSNETSFVVARPAE
jgi:hypothetical protein